MDTSVLTQCPFMFYKHMYIPSHANLLVFPKDKQKPNANAMNSVLHLHQLNCHHNLSDGNCLRERHASTLLDFFRSECTKEPDEPVFPSFCSTDNQQGWLDQCPPPLPTIVPLGNTQVRPEGGHWAQQEDGDSTCHNIIHPMAYNNLPELTRSSILTMFDSFIN